MKKNIFFISIFFLAVIAPSCNFMQDDMISGSSDNFIPVQEQVIDDVKVTLLSKNGIIRKGFGKFRFEFRDVNSGMLINVYNVNATAMMDMEGMTMMGDMNMNNMYMMGSCSMNYNLPMKGNWNCNLNFNGNKSVMFMINVI